MKMHIGYCETIVKYEDDFIIFGITMLDPWTGRQYTTECTAYEPLRWQRGIRKHPSYYVENGSEPILHEYAFRFNHADEAYKHMKSTVDQWTRVLGAYNNGQ